jgi:hypothetical protein
VIARHTPHFFCRHLHLSFATRNMPSANLVGSGNIALSGSEMRPETGPGVMEMVANSPSDRRQVGRQKDPQRSSVTNGSKLLAGIDGRPSWGRRLQRQHRGTHLGSVVRTIAVPRALHRDNRLVGN